MLSCFDGAKVGGFLVGSKCFCDILAGWWRQGGERATREERGARMCRAPGTKGGQGRPRQEHEEGTRGGRKERGDGEARERGGGHGWPRLKHERRRQAERGKRRPSMAATRTKRDEDGRGGQAWPRRGQRGTRAGKGGQRRPRQEQRGTRTGGAAKDGRDKNKEGRGTRWRWINRWR